MYARTHIYLTARITGSTNPYLLFGSVFPDFMISKCLPSGFDESVFDLMIFLEHNASDLLPAAMGMTLHEYPFGVDRFVHQSYNGREGYAFQFIRALYPKMKKVFSVPPMTAYLLSHFIVENAIEYKVLRQHPESEALLRKAFSSIDEDRIIKMFSKFYKISRNRMANEFRLYKNLNFGYDYSTYAGEGKAFSSILKKTLGIKTNPALISGLIREAGRLIAPSADSFLRYCEKRCKNDFKNVFGPISSRFTIEDLSLKGKLKNTSF